MGSEPRSRNDLVAAPHNLQGGHFAPLAIAAAGSGINVESFLCAASQTLCLNCHEGNRKPSRAERVQQRRERFGGEGSVGAIIDAPDSIAGCPTDTGSAERKSLD